MRSHVTLQPVLLRTVLTVQNTEVDTFSSEPLLNFIVVENIVITMNKTILLLLMFMLFFAKTSPTTMKLTGQSILA